MSTLETHHRLPCQVPEQAHAFQRLSNFRTQDITHIMFSEFETETSNRDLKLLTTAERVSRLSTVTLKED